MIPAIQAVSDGRLIAQAAIVPGQLPALQPGQRVSLLVEGFGQFAGTVAKLSPGSGQAPNSSVEIEVTNFSLNNGPLLLEQAAGRPFSSSIIHRRKLYQWMFPSRSASGRG